MKRFMVGKGECVVLRDVAGAAIRCVCGIVWVTQEGDREDYFLGASESLSVDRRGVVIVEARRGAVVDISGGCSWMILPPPGVRGAPCDLS